MLSSHGNCTRHLSQVWEVEEVSTPKTKLSEFELCEKHFQSTRTRLPDGRFQIRLLFTSTIDPLANTYQQARNALLKFEKSNESICKQYVEFMHDYLERSHMRIADTSDDLPRYYIPHLPVLRADSTTTKLRVVFNASAKNKFGVSLNDNLCNGPMHQPSLFRILLKFRKYIVAFSADVEKMYRQIVVHEDDRRFQSILWRFDTSGPIQTYELNTLTYGTGPAAYIATECLRETAKDVPDSQREVSEAITEEFWLDDELSGDSTVEKAIVKARRIHDVLMRAKFPLRKYVSNSKTFLESLPPEQVEKLRPVSFSTTGAAKILGLQWYPNEDQFRINFKPVDVSTINLSKRVVSSLIASIYDPLGLVNPILIRGKILLQDLWREELEWDDPIPEKIEEKFKEYYEDLRKLDLIQIPRPYSTFIPDEFELIGFSDASEKAYGAVVYVKSRNETSKIITLACSKSKVSPLKSITIPRLELLGTVLLCKLLSSVADALDYDIARSTAYCDSTIVLAWLKGPSSKYEVFVRNRVEYVNSILPFQQWNYVKKKDNPADLVTRGISVETLVENQLWLHGPSWLENNRKSVEVKLPAIVPETRKSYTSLVTCNINVDESIIASFSSFDKVVRITTLVKTFIARLRNKSKMDTVASKEAVANLLRISQLTWFQPEINALQNNAPIPARSRLISINPFLDQNGVLRVGGLDCEIVNFHTMSNTR